MQEDQDIRYFVHPDERFNVRAVLIVTHAGQVLVTPRPKDGQQRFVVPGGAVKFGETGEAAARREAQEELGLTLATLNLTGLIEAFFTLDQTAYHQLLMVYQSEVDQATFDQLAELDLSALDLPAGTSLVWQSAATVAAGILPKALGQCLTPGTFHHLVDRR